MKYIKTFNESSNHITYEKLYDIAFNETKDDRKFDMQYFPSFIAKVMNRSGLKEINEDLIDACQMAFCDVYFGGIEPEFESDEVSEWYYGLSPDYFEMHTETKDETNKYRWERSPYMDKSIPFLVTRDGFQAPHQIIYQ